MFSTKLGQDSGHAPLSYIKQETKNQNELDYASKLVQTSGEAGKVRSSRQEPSFLSEPI